MATRSQKVRQQVRWLDGKLNFLGWWSRRKVAGSFNHLQPAIGDGNVTEIRQKLYRFLSGYLKKKIENK